MPWLQLQINSSHDGAAEIEAILFEAGSLSVTLQDNANQPLFEPKLGQTPLWEKTRVTGLFDAGIDMVSLMATYPQLAAGKIEIVEDRDWEREWMANYKVMSFGKRLCICPSWLTPPDSSAVNLMLDPGLAFGTGTHSTTRLCLEWLDQQDLEGATVVDYGCGSGILSVAALMLGASKVLSIDNDPQALLATRENIKRNKIAPSRLQILLPNQIPENIQADVVIANILADPLCELSAILLRLLRPAGQLVLSGILEHQQHLVAERYRPAINFSLAVQHEDWIRMQGTKGSE